MRKRICASLLALAVCVSVPAGCERSPEPVEFSTFAMDTVMSFTLYGDKEECSAARAMIGTCLSSYEASLSATREDSDVSRINGAEGQPVQAGSAGQLLRRALELCGETGGALDITAYPAVKAWGFPTGEHRVPSPEELAALAEKIDYTAVRLEGDAVTLPAEVEIDLGAVAKGYVGDVLAGQLGLTSALLDLGQSTLVAVGSKPGGKPWRIGVRDPAGDGHLAVLELSGMAMGTSGGYQRYFEQDGVTYWHILDPKTAAPARSALSSVTVVAPSALTCDALSTALFVMGPERGAAFWRERRDFEAILIGEDGHITITAGLESRFSLAKGYEDREVTVLK